jgi:hypothetical protein
MPITPMLSLDQIQRELKAIEAFNTLYALAEKHWPDEVVGKVCRMVRKQELLDMAEEKASRN